SMAPQDWQTLTGITAGSPFYIERVRLADQEIAVEGRFEVPPLARLTADDQVFVAAFIRCHGSIKQMEKFFGVSYPTIKNRLNRIGQQLPMAEIEPADDRSPAVADVLSSLERGEISVRAALLQLKGGQHE